MFRIYRKFPKYSDTPKICCNHSQIWTMWLYHRVVSPNDADRMAIKQCRPWPRSSLIWVCIVCPDLSVRKLRIIMVLKVSPYIWAPSSEFVSSSIPSWQISTAHVQPFRGSRDLVFCLKVPLDSLLVWASSEGSGQTARMRRLAWTFAARIGNKYQIRLTWSIFNFIEKYHHRMQRSEKDEKSLLLSKCLLNTSFRYTSSQVFIINLLVSQNVWSILNYHINCIFTERINSVNPLLIPCNLLRLGYTMQLCCIQHERCIMTDRVAHTKTLFHATFWSCIQLQFWIAHVLFHTASWIQLFPNLNDLMTCGQWKSRVWGHGTCLCL